jgi:hypothetical protein
MSFFYVLLGFSVVALMNLLLSLLSLKGEHAHRLQLPAERRQPTLNQLEVQNLGLIEQLVGEKRRVQPLVPLQRLIRPARQVSTWRARRWQREINTLSVDLAVFSADGSQPLCAILVTTGAKPPRRVRREQALVEQLCKQADLPVLTLSSDERHDPERLKNRLEEWIEPLEVSLSTEHPLASEDEDALLAGLAAAMQDRSVANNRASRR